VGAYRLTIRTGPRVERLEFDHLECALEELEKRGRRLEGEAVNHVIDLRMVRRFEPAHQVIARLELAGPSRTRVGIDVRGDGSAEGYTGRLRRRVISQRPGESAYEALARACEPERC